MPDMAALGLGDSDRLELELDDDASSFALAKAIRSYFCWFSSRPLFH